MNNRELIDYASDFAERCFAADGEVPSGWHAVRRNGEHFVIPVMISNKDVMTMVVRRVLELKDAIAVVSFGEWWIASLPSGAKPSEVVGRVEHLPEREEVVGFIAESEGEGVTMATRRIIRTDGAPRLGPLEVSRSTAHVGRFIDMLPRRKGSVQ